MQLEVGQLVEGKITGITNFGVFVEFLEGKTGMVHISEVAQTYVSDIRQHVKEGDTVKMKILTIADNGKIKEGAIKEICSDIDRGLWDGCFYWDIENYNNVTATNSLLNTAITQILSQQNFFNVVK